MTSLKILLRLRIKKDYLSSTHIQKLEKLDAYSESFFKYIFLMFSEKRAFRFVSRFTNH